MKQLFERFEQQSLVVEKVLEKSIELVRERKSPGTDLCAEIDAALRDLRSVYDEITEKLPEKAGGVTLPAGASARDLETIWKESATVKRNSLIAVLSEFIKVYSDDAWYLEAIQDQLDEAKGLLAQMEEDDKASPDVSSYVIFLECVKQDLEENIDLAHMIEDEGIQGFKFRAISGLQKKKYYIREEESAEISSEDQEAVEQVEAEKIEEPEETEEVVEPEETEEPEQAEESEEPEGGVLGYVDTVQGRVKVKIVQDTPETAAHASKFISKAREKFSPLILSLNILLQLHVFPVDKIDSGMKLLELMPKEDVDYLLAHGYIGTIGFEINGEEKLYYVPTSMTYACMRKADVAHFITSKLKVKDRFPESNDLISLKSWTADFAYRCKLLVDYLLAVDDEYMFHILRSNPASLKDYAYCNYAEIRGIPRTVATGILSETVEDEELKMLSEYVQVPDNDLVILVDDHAAISVFVEKLKTKDPSAPDKMLYAVADEPKLLYDAAGEVVEESDEAEESVETEETATETAEESAESQAAPSETESVPSQEEIEQPSEWVSPVKPLKSMAKMPSKNDFDTVIGGYCPLSLMMCRNLGCLQVASLDMIKKFSEAAFKPSEIASVQFEYILDTLINKGYLSAYEFEYQGENLRVYCQTELLRKCLQKNDYRLAVTKREKTNEKLPIAAFVARDQVEKNELITRYEKARAVIQMFDYESNVLSVLPNMLCLWFEDKGMHQAKMWFADGSELISYIVPYFKEGEIEYPAGEDNLLVVDMLDTLPDAQAVPAEGRRVFCMNDKGLYELVDGSWKKLGDQAEEEPAEDESGVQEAAEEEQGEEEASDTEMESREATEETDAAEAAEEQEDAPQEQDEIPTIELVVDDEDIVAKQKLLETVYQCFSKGKFYAGMTLLHGLEMEDDFYHRKAEQYGFALGDPYLEQDNRFANLQSVYDRPFGEDARYDLLAYAAYLRMYCSPTAAYDPYSINEISFLKDNIACGTFKPLNDLLNAIAHYVGRVQHGLDDKTIASAVMKQTQLGRIDEYSQKAKELQEAKLYKTTRANRRVSRTRLQLFGESSDIQAMLSVVAGDKRSDVKKVKAFLKEKGFGSIIEDDVIKELMQKAWDDNADAAKEKKAEPLKDPEKGCIGRQLREVFECLKDWADDVESGDKSKGSEAQDTLGLIQECKPYLTSALKEIQKKTTISLPIEEAASYVILEKTVALILERLEGNMTQERYRRNFYIDLLKAPFVALDEERMPIIESRDEQICALDFCKRAAMYVDVPERKWSDVVKKIFTYSADRKCFNFGCVEIIRKYLEELGRSDEFGEYNTQKTISGLSSPNREKQSPAKWREDFIARFEMAKSDEWFDLDTIRSIEERIKAQEEIYYRDHNYGIYGRALLRMIEYFDEVAQKKKPELQNRLDMLKEKYEEIESWPIVRVIQESIDKLRFGVADSYLVQAERGSFDIVEDNQQQESRLFEEFLSKYNAYYELAKPESGLTLEKAFTQTHPNVSSEDYKSAVTFLKYWPQKDRQSATNVDAIMRSIGQDKMLDKVTYKSKEGYFFVKFDEKQEYTPAHPIAKFGSQMYEKGLQVGIVSGSDDADDLFSDISAVLRKFNKDIPALIIVDTAIHKDVRRQLARKFMSSLTLVTFIILDRVMALHIANEKKAARWTRLLNCAVPFQPINPYSDDPTKEIPNEMFFGREDELKKILGTETAMLVFGGRQLGKTALLHHARNLSRDLNQGRWASYVDVKDKKVSDAAMKIGDTLVTNPRERFLVGTKRTNWTWNVLVSAIRDRLFVGQDCTDQFFLFIDEADAFLKDSAKRNYKELDDLLQLSTDTNYRFRFVLAGLRDVVQFHRDANANNSIVSKFKRLRIPPLEFRDARKLLVIPLSYLGFTFSNEEGDVIAQILHATNYFPGIIHFYAHKLIEQIHKSFNSSNAPSFQLKRDNLLLLLKDKEFRDLRKDRLEITLKLDDQDEKYYYTLALLLSYFNSNERAEGRGEYYAQQGVMVQGLLKCARDIDATAKISRLTESQMTTVLEELVELYILRKTPDEDGVEYYDFARTAFADMLGRKDEVQTKLINLMAEGGHEDD